MSTLYPQPFISLWSLPLLSANPGSSKESSILLHGPPSSHYSQDTGLLTSTALAGPPWTTVVISAVDTWVSSVMLTWFPSAVILLGSLAIPSSFSCFCSLVFIFLTHRSCFPQGPVLASSALFTLHPLEIIYSSWVQQLPAAVH